MILYDCTNIAYKLHYHTISWNIEVKHLALKKMEAISFTTIGLVILIRRLCDVI